MPPTSLSAWWRERREALLELAGRHSPVYGYGREALRAAAREGDVLLIANAGACGRVMASRYNLREPAGEILP